MYGFQLPLLLQIVKKYLWTILADAVLIIAVVSFFELLNDGLSSVLVDLFDLHCPIANNRAFPIRKKILPVFRVIPIVPHPAFVQTCIEITIEGIHFAVTPENPIRPNFG